MSISDVMLGEMLATRLCHDLTGPVGAVHNGAEFIDPEAEKIDPEIMNLIINSAQEGIARLNFYRQTYGRINDNGPVALENKRRVAQDFFARSKTKLDWADNFLDNFDGKLTQNAARLLLNMLIIVNSSLMKGGNILVEIFSGDAGGVELRVTGKGELIKLNEETDIIINQKHQVTSLNPHIVQQYLTVRIAQEEGMKLKLSANKEECRVNCL